MVFSSLSRTSGKISEWWTASLKFGAQMLNIPMYERGEESGSLRLRKDLRWELKPMGCTKTETSTQKEVKSGKFSMSPDSLHGRGSSSLQMHCLQLQKLPWEMYQWNNSGFSGLHWLVSYLDSDIPPGKDDWLLPFWRGTSWNWNSESLGHLATPRVRVRQNWVLFSRKSRKWFQASWEPRPSHQETYRMLQAEHTRFQSHRQKLVNFSGSKGADLLGLSTTMS